MIWSKICLFLNFRALGGIHHKCLIVRHHSFLWHLFSKDAQCSHILTSAIASMSSYQTWPFTCRIKEHHFWPAPRVTKCPDWRSIQFLHPSLYCSPAGSVCIMKHVDAAWRYHLHHTSTDLGTSSRYVKKSNLERFLRFLLDIRCALILGGPYIFASDWTSWWRLTSQVQPGV